MPRVNPQILAWARETAGLTIEDAVHKLGLKDARGIPATDRLIALETGEAEPTRNVLLKMAKQYRRPLLAFYMSAPPPKGDRGEDYRNLPNPDRGSEALVDALVRDVRARQKMVRSILEDEEDTTPVSFIGSMRIEDGQEAVLASIRQKLAIDLTEFRAQASPESAFGLLRRSVEAAGVFVLLIGNLGSHQTAMDVEVFRGFALADEVAPFIVINDQDAKAAWAFTLLHELTHLWLGTTGVSGSNTDAQIERFCNDVASRFLLPTQELADVGISPRTDLANASQLISDFARERHLSRSMVAYRLLGVGALSQQSWEALSHQFRTQWRQLREAQRERDRQREGGPNYYVVRRHRLGPALLMFVSRTLGDGTLTPTKASKILGVKPRSVQPLLSGAALPIGQAA